MGLTAYAVAEKDAFTNHDYRNKNTTGGFIITIKKSHADNFSGLWV